ncbi:MAG: flippase-like domain-containing protein [Muribaculaceae bacterium]|nr:flippase-like domain-containing protein [Muribaculaceae bacterium]
MSLPEGKSMSRRMLGFFLKIIIPMIVSVGLCWILFRGDSLEELVAVMKERCDYRWILAMTLLLSLTYLIRAVRWGQQLEAVGVKASLWTRVVSIFGTYAVNLVFPRLGEVWRCGFVAHRERAQFSVVAGTVIADRLADLLSGISFILATLLFGHDAIRRFISRYPAFYDSLMRIVTSPWLWIAVAVAVIAAVWFLRGSGGGAVMTRLRNFGRGLWDGFYGIRLMRHKWRWLALTIALWGCYFTQMILAFQAFQFTQDIFAGHGIVAVLVCFTLGSMAMGVPSNGGIGPYQIALIFGLSLYMPDSADPAVFEMESKAFANVVLGASTLLSVLLGLIAFLSIALSKRRR